jgi:hypothetical protein
MPMSNYSTLDKGWLSFRGTELIWRFMLHRLCVDAKLQMVKTTTPWRASSHRSEY